MFKKTLFATALMLSSASTFAATEAYVIDGSHTQTEFSWNHFGCSNPSANFDKIEGTINYDAADPTKSSVDVTIAIDSINSHVTKLDEHLQSADFFDAAQFPTATFKSTKIAKGTAKDEFKVTGDLTIHGVTKAVTLDATLNRAGAHPMSKALTVGFDAKVVIKRSEFGVGNYVPNVSDDVKIHITTEASVPKQAAK